MLKERGETRTKKGREAVDITGVVKGDEISATVPLDSRAILLRDVDDDDIAT